MLKTLLVPLDHSTLAEQALAPAAAIARTLGARLDVVLVHQQPSLSNLRTADWNNEQLQEERRYVENIAARVTRHGVEQCTHTVLTGEVADAIAERAHVIDADMIVMTSHGNTGFSRARLGSVAYDLVRESKLPVLVLRDTTVRDTTARDSTEDAAASKLALPFGRILIALDGSPASLAVLPAAMELARCAKATIVLLRVVEPVPLFDAAMGLSAAAFATGVTPYIPATIQDIEATEQVCSRARAELAEIAGLLADEELSAIESRVVVAAHPAAAIVDFATAMRVDVIAMSTHGRGLSRWLLGSVTDAVLRTSKFPLLLSRPVNSGVRLPAGEPFRATEGLFAAHAV